MTKLLRQETGMTADTALRLERVLGVSAGFWMNLQNSYDLTREQASRRANYQGLTPLVAA